MKETGTASQRHKLIIIITITAMIIRFLLIRFIYSQHLKLLIQSLRNSFVASSFSRPAWSGSGHLTTLNGSRCVGVDWQMIRRGNLLRAIGAERVPAAAAAAVGDQLVTNIIKFSQYLILRIILFSFRTHNTSLIS